MTDFSDARLRYLYESYRHGTMRAASEFLDMAPSSISRQIASLERDLGVNLVEKGRHTVRLTAAGEMAISYYRDRLAHRETFISALEDVKGNRTGNVTVAMGEGFIGSIVLNALRDYAAKFPGVHLSIVTGPTTHVMGLVREDEAHFGIVFEPPADSRIRMRAALPQPLRLIVYPSHPLAQQLEVGVSDLVGYKLILPDQNFRSRQLLQEVEAEANVHLDSSVTTGSLRLLKECVLKQMGIAISNELPLSDEIDSGELVSIPLIHQRLSNTQAYAITRIGRQLPGSAMNLLELLEARMKSSKRVRNATAASKPE